MRYSSVVILVAIAALVPNDSVLRAQQAAVVSIPRTCKICISELKQNSQKVYACTVEQYCQPRCGLLSLLRGECGCNDGSCGDLRMRHRLVVKKVPSRDTVQCAPREAPVDCPTLRAPVSGCAPAPARTLVPPTVGSPLETVIPVPAVQQIASPNMK
jgi:hypothetical protein